MAKKKRTLASPPESSGPGRPRKTGKIALATALAVAAVGAALLVFPGAESEEAAPAPSAAAPTATEVAAAPLMPPEPETPAAPESAQPRDAPSDAPAAASPPAVAPASAPPAERQTRMLPPLPVVPNPVNRPPEVIRDAYRFAAEHPEVLQYVPCYCGCELDGHRSNENCFVAARGPDGQVRWDTHGIT